MTENTEVIEQTEVFQILNYIDHEIFDINRHCAMITKNKCCNSFSDNEDLIMCGSCESKFCYECRRKGILTVHYTTVTAGIIELHEYAKCPICDNVGTLCTWRQGLSFQRVTTNRQQNECLNNHCIIS